MCCPARCLLLVNVVRLTRRMLEIAAAGFVAAAAMGCDLEEGTTVGPRGGIVSSDDGRVTLEVPAGALLDSIEISIVESDDGPNNASGPTYMVEPFGVTFLQPAHLTYDVSDGLMGDPELARLVTERDDGWEMLGDRRVDTERGEVSASLLYAAAICLVE